MSGENSKAPIPGTSSSIFKNFPRNAMGISGRTARLPSIRSPRDLTLGATTSKRVFVPNIPVRRERRNKSVEKKESPKKTEARKDLDLKGKRCTTHPRFQREYVSVPGAIFGEGLLATAQKKGNLTAVDVQSQISICKSKKECDGSPRKIKKEKDKADDAYLSDNFIDDDDDNDESDVDNQSYPLVIPMNMPFKKSSADDKFDPDGFPKSTSQPKHEFKAIVKQELISPSSQTGPSSLERLFSGLNLKSEDQLILFEYPANHVFSPAQGEPSTSKESIQEKQLSIFDFPEGYIGKLQRLRSGKYRFLIDGLPFDVVTNVSNPMHQELIAIQEEENETCVTELGQIQHMCKCVPSVSIILPSAQ